MSAAHRKRLRALETSTGAVKPRPLPCLVHDDITDADLDALRKKTGQEIFRESDDEYFECFIG